MYKKVENKKIEFLKHQTADIFSRTELRIRKLQRNNPIILEVE